MSDEALEDQRLLGLIRHSYQATSGVYDYRRVLGDLRVVEHNLMESTSTTETILTSKAKTLYFLL